MKTLALGRAGATLACLLVLFLMPVKLIAEPGSLSPLTSPTPSIPDPIPPSELIDKVMDYHDRKVWVTIPFCDKISLITDLTNEIQDVPDQSGKKAKQVYIELDGLLKGKFSETPLVPGGPIVLSSNPKGDNEKAVFLIEYAGKSAPERAQVTFARRMTKKMDYPVWSCRLEFNPFKAGPSGLEIIREAIEIVIAPFINFDRMLAAFEISRVDAAVDCIGARPMDLIVKIPKPGKRVIYASNGGEPESVYLHERKADPKTPPVLSNYRTVGPLRLKLYERSAYQRQICQPQTYGGCPVTRAEITKAWTKGRPLFSTLDELENLFVGRSVSYAAAVPPHGTSLRKRMNWRKFCIAAFVSGTKAAAWAQRSTGGQDFRKWFDATSGDLVEPSAWERWQDGLNYSGLSEWLKAAKAIEAD